MLQFDGTLIVLAISFILFTFIMQWIFYGPMTKVRKNRENYVQGNLDAAQQAVEEAKKLSAQRDEKIALAKKTSTETVSKSTHQANKNKAVMVEEANKLAQDEFAQKKEEIAQDKAQARDALKEHVVQLAHSISTKVLQKEVPMSGVSHEMIERALNS